MQVTYGNFHTPKWVHPINGKTPGNAVRYVFKRKETKMSPPRSIKDAKKLPILPDEHEFAVIIRLDMVMQYYDAVESRYWVVIQGGDGKWYRK